MLGGSHKHINMLLHKKSPLCKLKLGDTTMKENSISPSTYSKLQFNLGKISPMRLAHQRRVILPKGRSLYKSQVRERSLSMLTCPKEREEATATCNHLPCLMETINLSFLLQVGYIKWNCKWENLVRKEKAKWIPKKTRPKRGIDSFLIPWIHLININICIDFKYFKKLFLKRDDKGVKMIQLV